MGRLGEDFRLLLAEREAENEAGGGWHYYGGGKMAMGGGDPSGPSRASPPVLALPSLPTSHKPQNVLVLQSINFEV